jgi:hypothetical protein
MNCLPRVDRELRVAARKRSTFWLRVVAAVTGAATARVGSSTSSADLKGYSWTSDELVA